MHSVKSIYDIRHANLMTLIQEAGGISATARRIGRHPAQVSQLKNRLKHSNSDKRRQIGDETARLLEAAFDREDRWMDHDHSGTPPPAPAVAKEPAALYLTSSERDLVLAFREILSPAVRDRLVAEVMAAAAESQQLTAAVLQRYGVTGTVDPERAAQFLPPAPEGSRIDTTPGELDATPRPPHHKARER